MAEPTTHATPEAPPVRVARTIKAPRIRVYGAWTNPDLLMHWFVDPGGDVRVVELDLRTGGRYRLEGLDRGRPWRIEGRYLEVTPPSKLVYTWTWDNDAGLGDKVGRDTLVTVEFLERLGDTEVVVTHERLATERARKDHASGWVGCLERLGGLAEEGRS